ncbi:GntR family transcriptional regulator [Paenibacillus hodogayensis]|uniref:GntR family transcriptional regulator n=1 Tax=Paenibacillus hodogayensis TaxID=279208 RepID=A0ABV5VNW2_9BACL
MKHEAKRIPLYSQIRSYILEQIQRDQWRANDQLPTEAVLADQFEVSRFTIKKALSELVEEGLVYRVQGKGTFIAPAVTEQRDVPGEEEQPGAPLLKLVMFIAPSVSGSLTARIMAGAEEQLSERGYQIVYRSSLNNRERERGILQECVRMGIKGILIFPVDGESYSEELLRLSLNKFPVVVIDRYLRGVETNCVCSDHAGGAYEAVTYLIEQGHSEIAYVSVHGKTTTSLEDRLNGYERALMKHQIPIDYQRCLYELMAGREQDGATPETKTVVRSFLERNRSVTAVFAATVASGLAVLGAAEELGIRVPEQLSVIIFDDYEFSAFSRVPPTCVVQQEHEIGTEAAKLLLSVMSNPLQERKKVLLPTRLVLRQSTARRED